VRVVDVVGPDGERVLARLQRDIPARMFELGDDGVHHIQAEAGAGNFQGGVMSLGRGFDRTDDSEVESVNRLALAAPLLIVTFGVMMMIGHIFLLAKPYTVRDCVQPTITGQALLHLLETDCMTEHRCDQCCSGMSAARLTERFAD
jgi:hypothetical protein